MKESNSNSVITIIIPVFNSEQYIEKCLLSVVNQSYPHIDIICIDDGSTDNSLSLIKKTIASDSRVTVFTQDNLGAAAARNIGLKHAKGEYIMFCDSDDWYNSDMCETMISAIKQHDVDLVSCDANFISKSGYIRKSSYIDYCRQTVFGKQKLTNSIKMSINVLLWNKIFKKSIIDRYNIDFPEICRSLEDNAFTCNYLAASKTLYGLEDKLYNYNIHNESLMAEALKRDNKQKFDGLYAIEYIYHFLIRNNLFSENSIFFNYAFNLYNYWRNFDDAEKTAALQFSYDILKNIPENDLRTNYLKLIRQQKFKEASDILDRKKIYKLYAFCVGCAKTLLPSTAVKSLRNYKNSIVYKYKKV